MAWAREISTCHRRGPQAVAAAATSPRNEHRAPSVAARETAAQLAAVAAAFPRPFATVASLLIATAVVLRASNALARPASLRRGALLLYAAAAYAVAPQQQQHSAAVSYTHLTLPTNREV